MAKEKVDNTLSSEISVLDSLLDPAARLAKKYLLDAEGKLKLYHPITQRCFWALMNGETPDLMDELKKYHAEKRCKEKKGTDCEGAGE